jgi:uncharacterized Zn-finger protein
MTKEQVVNILNGMDCEIAQVEFSFYMEGLYCQHDVLVYLVDEPSNDDQIINSMHHWIYSNIEEFNDEIEDYTNGTLEFLNVTEFISDFDD